MKKIYIILPDNIPLLLCGKGYTVAFNAMGLFAGQSVISELDDNKVLNFKPDYLLFFDFDTEIENLADKIYKINENCIFIFYLTEKLKKEQYAFIQKITNNKFKILILTADKENLKLSDSIKYLPLGINAKKYKTEFEGYTNTINITADFVDKKSIGLFKYLYDFFEKIAFCCDETEYIKSIESKYFQDLPEDIQNAYKNSYKGNLSTEKERSKNYSESYINIILNNKIKSGIDFSVLEAAASCGLVFCKEEDEVKRLFDTGHEIETFDNYETLVQKAEFYMKYPEIGRSAGLNARRAVINNHSVYDRAKEIIRITDKKFKTKEKNNE